MATHAPRTATRLRTCTTTGTSASATSIRPSIFSPNSPPSVHRRRCWNSVSAPVAWRFPWHHAVSMSSGSTPVRRCWPSWPRRIPTSSVTVQIGDMVDDLPAGPFALVFVAFNTFFGLLTEARQQACFAAVADRLVPGGAFVIEAFVPEPQDGPPVVVRSMTADSVVLSITTHDESGQIAQGHYVSLSEAGGVRMRPWAIRYATTGQLDAMARTSGFRLAERWEDAQRAAVHRRERPSRVGVSHNSQPCPS